MQAAFYVAKKMGLELGASTLLFRRVSQVRRIFLKELERFFASGSVISIASELDLIDVGARIAADDKQSVQRWMDAGLLHKTTDNEASEWAKNDALLWVVVVKDRKSTRLNSSH